MLMSLLKKIKKAIYSKLSRESPRLLFNILVTFLITFTIAHITSLFIPFYLFIKGYHIHHFYYGMLALAIASIGGILTNNGRVKRFLSYVIGYGIGMIVDELGLLLTCTTETLDKCVYLFPSIFDIVVIVSLIFIILILFGDRPVRWFLPKSWRNFPASDPVIKLAVDPSAKPAEPTADATIVASASPNTNEDTKIIKG